MEKEELGKDFVCVKEGNSIEIIKKSKLKIKEGDLSISGEEFTVGK